MSAITRRLLGSAAAVGAMQAWAARAFGPMHFAGAGGTGGEGGPTIVLVSLSNSNYPINTANAVVGPVNVLMSSGSFTGTLAISGANSGGFTLSSTTLPCNLLTNSGGTTGAGPYNDFTITATQVGISNSPQSISLTVTGYTPGTNQVTFVNDGTVTMPAGQPTQVFGWIFKDGDIAANSAPIFSVSGAPQPYSAGCQCYWPSGCLKSASFMLRPTFSLGAGASQIVTIAGSGNWPAASGRTLTEVYAQNLTAQFPPNTPNTGRSTSVGSWLRSDGNNYRAVQWLDGAAGAAWKVSTKCAATIGGTADATLLFDHYIVSLNNSSGGLGGFRWFGALRQPLYNGSTEPDFVWFAPPNTGSPSAGVNWSVGGGTPTPLQWTQFANPASFTCVANTFPNTSADANAYYTGGGSNGNFIPGILSGGSLSAPYTDGMAVFALNSNNSDLLFCFGPVCTYDLVIEATANGSGTFTPCPAISPFTRLHFADKNARYNFFAGTGSGISAETTLRAQINQTYWQSTAAIPPYQLNLIGTGAIPDSTYPFDWNPYCIVDVEQNLGQGGDHSDIGVLPNIVACDFFNQSKTTDKIVRALGLVGGLHCYDFRDASGSGALFDAPVNIADPGATFTGFPASVATSVTWAGRGGPQSGFTISGNAGALGLSTSTADHFPRYSIWAWLRTGELQYLDYVTNLGIGGDLQIAVNFRNPPIGYPYSSQVYGVTTYWDNQFRSMGWRSIDLQNAAFWYPHDPSGNNQPTFSDGFDYPTYLNNLADVSANFPIDMWNIVGTLPGNGGTYQTNAGLYLPFNPTGSADNTPAYMAPGPEWEFAYLADAMIMAALRGNAKALQFLELLATRWNYYATSPGVGGYWTSYGYGIMEAVYPDPYTSSLSFGYPVVTSDAQRTISFISAASGITNWGWNSANSPKFSGSGYLNGDYAMADGDILMFMLWQTAPTPNSPNQMPAGFSPATPYYVVNLSVTGTGPYTYTFDLSASPGGSPMAVTDAGPTSGWAMNLLPKNPPALSFPYFGQAALQMNQAASWCNAIGLKTGNTTLQSMATTLIADVVYRATNTPEAFGSGGSTGEFYFDNTGVPYETLDARYCWQTSFA